MRSVVKQHLMDIAHNDLPHSQAIGYHGTSIESVQFLLEHGYLAGMTSCNAGPARGIPGDLYFYPQVNAFPQEFKRLYPHGNTAELMAQRTYGYAIEIAQRHAFLSTLNWPLRDARVVQYNLAADAIDHAILAHGPRSRDEENRYAALRTFGKEFDVSARDMVRAKVIAGNRHGIVLALDRAALDEFPFFLGDEFNYRCPVKPGLGDLYFRCPNGFPYRFVCGIRPLGPDERSYARSWK